MLSLPPASRPPRRFPSRLYLLPALCALAVPPVNATPAHASLHFGLVWYGKAPDDHVRRLAATRYELGITGLTPTNDKVEIKQLNPSFRWFIYNSITDNYVPPYHSGKVPEHDLLVSLARQKGWDPEIAYLHYDDDTRIALGGDTLTVPGWGQGSATAAAEARVPVYYPDRSRVATDFSSPRSAQLHKEAVIHMALDAPFPGSATYADGIFLDNSAAKALKCGVIVSGGHVLEAPGHPKIDSDEFREWRWTSSFAPFLTALKDTLETSASWSKDGKRKYLMANISSRWDDSYVQRDVADIFFLEFAYNPITSPGPDRIDQVYRSDSTAAAAGMTFFYAPGPSTSASGHPGSFSHAEALLGNFAWYLMTRTPNSIFFNFGTAVPTAAAWDTLTWCGAMDVARDQLGEPTGPPYTLAEGTDPLGNQYVVKARPYDNGLVVLRNRGRWNQGIEKATGVTVRLPRPLAPVTPSGRILRAVQELILRNGQGAILLG